MGLSSLATIFLATNFFIRKHPSGYIVVACNVTSINAQTPSFQLLAEYSRGYLPHNAALLVDEHERLENKVVQFAADRTCYPATKDNWRGLAAQLEQSGALPYLLTPASVDLPKVFTDDDDNRTLYACTPAALAAVDLHAVH